MGKSLNLMTYFNTLESNRIQYGTSLEKLYDKERPYFLIKDKNEEKSVLTHMFRKSGVTHIFRT